jgi:hypothetical protein
MREVEKMRKAAAQRIVIKLHEEQKKENIAESFEQSGKSNQAIRKDIQHDDKMLASNYNKILKMLLF